MPGQESFPPPTTPPEGTLPPPPPGSEHLAHMAHSLDNLVALLTPSQPKAENQDNGRFTVIPDFTPVERLNARVIDGLPLARPYVEPRAVPRDLVPSNPIEAFAHEPVTTNIVDVRTPALAGLRKAVLNVRLRHAYNVLDSANGNDVNKESARVARGEFPLEIPDPSLRPVTIPERRASRHAYRKAGRVGDLQAKQNLLSYLWDDDERSISDRQNFKKSVKEARLTRGEKRTALGERKDFDHYGQKKKKYATELLAMEITGRPDKRHARKVLKAAHRIGTLGERVGTLSALQQRDRRARQIAVADRYEARVRSGRTRFDQLVHEAELNDQGLDSRGEASHRYMGISARMKRNRASGIAQDAFGWRSTSNLLRSNQNLRDRGTVISTRDGADAALSIKRKADYVSLVAKDVRERIADRTIANLHKRADKLEQHATTGVRRGYIPMITTKTAPSHVRTRYQQTADKRRAAAQRIADRADNRRSQI